MSDLDIFYYVDSSDYGGFYAKGHHDKALFAETASRECAADVKPEDVHHDYWRVVPDATSKFDSIFIKAIAGRRGAFAVTYSD